MKTKQVKAMYIPANDITTDINQIVLVSLEDEILVEGDIVVISEDGDDEIDVVLSIYTDGKPKLANRVVGDDSIVRKVICSDKQMSPDLVDDLCRCGYNKELDIEMTDVYNLSDKLYRRYEPKLTNGYITVVVEKEYSHNLLWNMQYYMEYCQAKGYVAPQVWLNKHKHYKDIEEEPTYTEKHLKQAFDAGNAYGIGSFKEFKQIHPNYIEWKKQLKK